ncbi:variant erythrocyte surface antigen-1 alpha subunit [Babesia bovis T2Bo]|uniref:Variant erythrocyte surface antigen-1, alpha subunit n=1 Tax=Babesia bovis TaxID=5865 RepID=A7AT37_BABBO|nr:variant erythrocyte surface antigen-1 alpha subunit [Babesia bovis T2Bo]EDO06098.1 variant erythrocyte surface antigen-1 alpha subunit [Babesia bovis T2Bo]|eukprot:XP_001609666.1 variant erythrocyte surface antigen-1, alpha subunit [Babesia bovis T2Bo]
MYMRPGGGSYQGEANGDDTKNGPPKKRVTKCLNELFSLVQGLGGTAVVRTYIDQLAQVLSALVGWSKIEKCWSSGGCGGDSKPHGQESSCTYLKDVKHENKCDKCKCMKWDVKEADDEKNGHHLGRGCKKCASDEEAKKPCSCSGDCTAETCKCALAGKCCKCCCKEKCTKCSDKCSCMETHKNTLGIFEHKDSYRSAYQVELVYHGIVGNEYLVWPKWSDRKTSKKRAVAARNLLGSVCLIWSGITYMYWTGKYHSSSPRWNNHILDGTGLDDGTLSQWLQALGFPKAMLNNSGPQNRLDKVIWDGIMDKLYLGFPNTGTGSGNGAIHGHDNNANTFRQPAGMNYAGYIHTVDKGAFCSKGNVFNNGSSSTSEENTNKCGALYKLYILSCAYFTGLQQKALPKAENKTPKTIREILYWLSALPYSPAYPKILEHSKDKLKKVAPKNEKNTETLSFLQTGRSAPITVDEFNLFAHFQAVTQYCPLVLIGIQGGLKGTNSTTPAIHSLYANTACNFTYPTVSIQAYNQVVHYIRALFYQLYFLRKQCAMKVALGGKWRECRYGSGVLGKDVVSWMCLGCDPMEHDRKSRVKELKKILWKVPSGKDTLAEKLKDVLEKIGEVVVQLGNAQEALETKDKDVIEKVKEALRKAKEGLETAKNGLKDKLEEAKKKLDELTNGGGSGILGEVVGGSGLDKANNGEYDPGKNKLSAAIKGVRDVLEGLRKGVIEIKKKEIEEANQVLGDIIGVVIEDNEVENVIEQGISQEYTTLLDAINKLISICNSPKCPPCHEHAKKCGKQSNPTVCQTCLQPTTTGVPSPLQAFLEDRLPGFSCDVVRNTDTDTDTVYPPAASHLGHCNGSGQCCPLPMGFRGQFYSGIRDMTGAQLYGILYFFSNENMMQSCVYTLVRVTAALSATTPQVLGDVFGFFRGGVGEKDKGKPQKGDGQDKPCEHQGDPSDTSEENNSKYFCGWCASGLRDEVKKIEWIPFDTKPGGQYMDKVGTALINIKGDKGSAQQPGTTSLSRLTDGNHYVSPLTGELYTAVSATFGGTYLSWVLYLSDALEGGLKSLASAFQEIECRGCKGQCDPNKCKKGSHGGTDSAQCNCQSIVSCTGVLPVLYRHGFSYGNPFNLEGYEQRDGDKDGQYDIENKHNPRRCHQFLESLTAVIDKNKQEGASQDNHPLTELLKQVGQLQYDIRLPWIFVLTIAWLAAVLYLAFGAIWPLDWSHMRSHLLRGGEHQWESMWYKVMTGRKGMELVEYFDQCLLVISVMV